MGKLLALPWVMSKEEFRKVMDTKEESHSPARWQIAAIECLARRGQIVYNPSGARSFAGWYRGYPITWMPPVSFRNRSIGDIMRYAAINEGLDTLAHYGDLQPAPGVNDLQWRTGDTTIAMNSFMRLPCTSNH